MPILAALHAGTAGRQAPLLVATGASRTAFAQSMDHLVSMGLVERNPGFGHPLRPEFRLTTQGTLAAAIASNIQSVTTDDDQGLLRRSWTLPVLAAIHRPSHFGEIKRTLRTITDRALSQSLKSMEARRWVLRQVDQAARPPRALYRAVNKGGLISTVTATQIGFVQDSSPK